MTNLRDGVRHRSIHSLMQNGTFHCNNGAEDDFVDDTNVYVDLGEDCDADLSAALCERLKEARDCGMSAGGLQRLENMLNQFNSILE